MKTQYKIGESVVHHFCGGSVFGTVSKVNKKSVVILDKETGKTITFPKSRVSYTDGTRPVEITFTPGLAS